MAGKRAAVVGRTSRSAMSGWWQPDDFLGSQGWVDTSTRLVRGFITAAEKIVTNDNRGAMSPKDDDESKGREGE